MNAEAAIFLARRSDDLEDRPLDGCFVSGTRVETREDE